MIWQDHRRLLAIFFIHCLCCLGCSRVDRVTSVGNGAEAASRGTPPSRSRALTAESIPRRGGPTEQEYPALHNLLQVSGTIFSGGEPRGDEAFASLARLGVKTVVSVDGAKPDVELARKHGLRYVHIPIGYDGVERVAGLSLARLVREASGPFYIHCHHGRHRGPAAAAVACIAAGEVNGEGALKILERAGTSKGYAKLWRDVEGYQAPREDAELPELVAVARVDSFAAAMAQMDRAYSNLKLCRDAQWSTPPGHPDLLPAQEALLVKEGLRETVRNLSAEFSDEFRARLAKVEALAQVLEDSLKRKRPKAELSRQFKALEMSCKLCHEEHRN